MISLVVAMDKNNLIGAREGHYGMPWHVKEDLRHFQKTTTGHAILVGSTTFAAMGRPLPNRINYVLTSRDLQIEGAIVVHDLDSLLEKYHDSDEILYICGGAVVFKQTIDHCDELLISRIPGDFEGDTYFPEIDMQKFRLAQTIQYETFTLEKYERLI